MNKKTSSRGWIAAAIVIVVIAAGGVYLARKAMHPETPTAATSAASASSAESASAAIEHPIGQAGGGAPASASTTPLPPLDGSDDSVVSALRALTGGSDLSALLMQPQVVQRIVATVDALPRRGLNRVMLPVRSPQGSFSTQDADGSTVMAAQNDARYAPYMQVVRDTDPDKLVAWYVHAYPLFQQAYRQLGYPKAYFNDRLIAAIDNLLAAPDLKQRPTLVLSNGYYRYTDPGLESLSSGQRALLRAGPDNEVMLKAKLRAIRALLVGQKLRLDSAPAAAGTAA
ncbi:MAG: DUF3014 domain-containing protein [Pseudomonadota bacterium]|nr:DUF3014 domain-containing protein [Pseudomonadota bacterium]